MQIRLTVALGARGGAHRAEGSGEDAQRSARATSADVIVSAPAGTVLASVASALATTATASAAPAGPAPVAGAGAASVDPPQEPVVFYAGTQRLDPQLQLVGEPPLLDGAVLSLHSPVPALAAVSAYGAAKARLHVVAGPDSGGIHLLQGGRISLGRAAEADVPVDDPDVSRLHCAVTVSDNGAVSVADLGSTNGTTVDGVEVGAQPVLFTPGSLLRLGETAFRLEVAGPQPSPEAAGEQLLLESGAAVLPDPLRTCPDGHGRLRLTRPEAEGPAPTARDARARTGTAPGDPGSRQGAAPGSPGVPHPPGEESAGWAAGAGPGALPPETPPEWAGSAGPTRSSGVVRGQRMPETQGERPRAKGLGAWARRFAGGQAEGEAGLDGPSGSAPSHSRADSGALPAPPGHTPPASHAPAHLSQTPYPGHSEHSEYPGHPSHSGHPGSSGSSAHSAHPPHTGHSPRPGQTRHTSAAAGDSPERWPDPATVLLTALGPGPLLWRRGPGHPDAMTVRLGTAHRPDGSARALSVDLRETGAVGVAGPRSRLSGLARSVLARLAVEHGPSALEIVLISADRSRSVEERTAEWGWLGWLPHLRPARGQQCRLLMAYDRDQATARAQELARRLEEERRSPTGPGHPYTLLIVDGDAGSATVRETVERLAAEGAAAGIHVLCLAETAPATPASPVAATLESARAAAPTFRVCGGVAVLSGDVATAVRLIQPGAPGAEPQTASGAPSAERPGEPSGVPVSPASGSPAPAPAVGGMGAEHPRPEIGPSGAEAGGTEPSGSTASSGEQQPDRGERDWNALAAAVAGAPIATVDGVSIAWAERFARALAPLREPEGAAAEPSGGAPVAVELPKSCRLLDELGLARATPAALLARWGSEPDGAAPGRARMVLGAGPRGSVEVELSAARGHALVSGERRTGKTELLRSIAASVAAGERPDRLGLLLVDGAGPGTTEGDGLRICAELPHVSDRLAVGDPTRMRDFAQALSGELKRRAELIGGGSYEQYVREVSAGTAASGSGEHQRATQERQLAGSERSRNAAESGVSGRSAASRAESESSAGAGQSVASPHSERPGSYAGGAGASRQRGEPAEPRRRTEAAGQGEHPGRAEREPGAEAGEFARASAVAGSAGRMVAPRVAEDAPQPSAGSAAGSAPITTPQHAAEVAGAFGGRGGGDPRDARQAAEGSRQVPGPPSRGSESAGGAEAVAGQPGGTARSGAASQWPEAASERGASERVERARALASGTAGAVGTAGAGGAAGAAGSGEPAAEARGGSAEGQPLPRLVVLVDDFDALVDPDLGNPGRPAAGSVVRALESVAREGARLGVHLVAATGRPERTEQTTAAHVAAVRVELHGSPGLSEASGRGGSAGSAGAGEGAEGTDAEGRRPVGRGTLTVDAGSVPFQGGLVTGRIPRTATLRPTVVPLDWARAGDPPTRRQVRELGNGPTDLALLASAIDRAARSDG